MKEPGFYPDPDGSDGPHQRYRYWDGEAWESKTPTAGLVKKTPTARVVKWDLPPWPVVMAFVATALFFIWAAVTGGGDGGSKSSPSSNSDHSSSSVSTQPREVATTTTATVTVTQTAAPTTTNFTPPAPQPESKLVPGLMLPAGSVLHPPVSDAPPPGMPAIPTPDGMKLDHESWTVPLSPADTASALKPQLPIRKPLHGIPWCEELNGSSLRQWDWASSTYAIVVGVTDEKDGTNVWITRGLDDTGRGGCD